MKILHIHSDEKFIKGSLLPYLNENIDNDIVFLGSHSIQDDKVKCFKHEKKNYKAISDISAEYDIVIFYSMSLQHALICNLIKKSFPKKIVLWRFFGAELYGIINRGMLAPASLKYYKDERLHHILSIAKNLLLHGATSDAIFWKAVGNTDYFLGLAEEEYKQLKQNFRNLPPFLQLPYKKWETTINNNTRHNQIIIGHSKDLYGNHLEVLKMMSSLPCLNNYQYKMFFSYSEYSTKYSKAVCDYVKEWPSMEVIQGFMPREEYMDILNNSDAVVINSYRQMGMGMVFNALRDGLKVYLNPLNPMYNWLIKYNFCVYTINDFIEDLQRENVCLSMEQKKQNVEARNKLASLFSYDNYWGQLKLLVNTNV